MRLLKYEVDGELIITNFDDDELPPYAILSHTWGAAEEEVTFADLAGSSSKAKYGYKKIRFCGEQARHDGLQYFWVDTCCIDTSDKAEHSWAIRSMFRWYQNATKCYAYLSDVSTRERKADNILTEFPWESAFRSSRWFTRGWTLQELLAPRIVEFFSQDWEKLGDKISLKPLLRRVTSIPHEVFDGAPLSQFSIDERLRWKGDRKTQLEEDGWYSLSGIFDVEIAPAYSEGAASAFRRLMDEIHKLERCIQDIRHTDPRDDKKRIEDTKGGLLTDSYCWVLDNDTFQKWQQDPHSRLLWVKGDPGKGKTMLLCGIINELPKLTPQPALLSYFFCQAADSRINSATAVLRGLLYMLVIQQPSLVSHVRKKYDRAGKTLFEDTNAWIALTEIFVDVLQAPSLSTTYLIIDALDECITDRPKLLNFIALQSSRSDRVKWVVSGRNWSEIEAQLERAGHKVRLSLELNAKSVAAAVDIFIQQKVYQLAQEKQYKAEVRHAVLQHLTSNANDTFLWVALVCQDLKMTAGRHVLKKLALFPPGLDDLYKRMVHQISESDDAEICCRVLALTAILYRPVTITELVTLVEQLEEFANDLEVVREIITLCGSFLTIREDTVYFVHQSAKDFLFTKVFDKIFPAGTQDAHQAVFSTSLAILSRTLYRDMYNLKAPGFAIENVEQPIPDPLAASRYPCVYWIDHLYDSKPMFLANSGGDLQVKGIVDEFLRKKYLYWLEGLSLCKSIGKGVLSMAKLWSLVQDMRDRDKFPQLIQDAWRYVMYHRGLIENYPLQTYTSALLFSPTGSLIRQLFKHEEPVGITIKPAMGDSWSACLLTLEGHSSTIVSVAFSHDSTRLASASNNGTVKVWDARSGECLLTLGGNRSDSSFQSVAFSHDSTRLALVSGDTTVEVWDASSGECLLKRGGHSSGGSSLKLGAFSHDLTRLASASSDDTVKVWNVNNGECLSTFEDHSSGVICSVAFSHDLTCLALASFNSTLKVWDVSSSRCLSTLEDHRSNLGRSEAFSHDLTRLASTSKPDDTTVKVWDVSSGECLSTLKGHSRVVLSVAFSHDSTRLVSGSFDNTVKVWDISSSECLWTLEGHAKSVFSVAFSQDLSRLASASSDKTIKVWDISSSKYLSTLEGYGDRITLIAFSNCLTRVASASFDGTIKVWDTRSGECLLALEGHIGRINSLAFSYDSTRLASGGWNMTMNVWNASSGECLLKLNKGNFLRNSSDDVINIHAYLRTQFSPIDLSKLSWGFYKAKPANPKKNRLALSKDNVWIKNGLEPLLWIPSEFRPSCSAISGDFIAFGVGNGRVWSCRVQQSLS